jgi:hypothetical protein
MIDIINKFIKENNLKSFLLIGEDINVYNRINCEVKKQITNYNDFYKENTDKFDVILIDGLHHSEQAEIDLVESWKMCNENGLIFIHDIKPNDEAMQVVPRKQALWTGDVWRVWHGFITKYLKIKAEYLNDIYGLGLIYKSKNRVSKGFISDIEFKEYFEGKLWEVK